MFTWFLVSRKKAFTLVELVVAITILSVIMLSVFLVYATIVNANKRLELLRAVQESSRTALDEIAKNVREKGIDFSYYDGSDAIHTLDYTGSGNLVLAVKGGTRYYLMSEGATGNMVACTISTPASPCFIGMETSAGHRIRLTDERVEVRQARFYLSGDDADRLTNLSKEGKVVVILSLGIAPKKGISSDLAESTNLHIQTTLSERAYKVTNSH